MKNGCDYFPFEVRLDDSMRLIEAQFGLKGFAIIVKLWQKIYGGYGYYCEFTSDIRLLFSRECLVNCSLVSNIVECAIQRGIFDRTLYEKYQILTSAGIQRRYLKMTSRRECVKLKNEYLLINCAQNAENADKNGENVYRNQENVYRNSQSKVNKSKVNISNDILGSEHENDNRNVLIFNKKTRYEIPETAIDEYARLYPGIDVSFQFKKMKEWLRSNVTRTKPEKFITDWLSREKAAIHETVNDDGGLDFDLDDIFEKP